MLIYIYDNIQDFDFVPVIKKFSVRKRKLIVLNSSHLGIKN